MSQTLNLISNVYMRTGRFAEAEPLLKRAIEIQEKIRARSSRRRKEPHQSRRALPSDRPYRTGRAAATPRANIQEKALTPEHPHVGVTLNNWR